MTFTHARRIAEYNRPRYAAAGIGILVAVVVALLPATPSSFRWAAAVAAVVIAWFACASFWAFHWMFDRSELLGGRWLTAEVTPLPARWIQINAGLEETTVSLSEVFPEAEWKMLDIYDPEAMTEPAITRARQERTSGVVVSARSDAIPVDEGWGDLVLVMLAAHEIRDSRARERFFRELARIVSPRGRVVLVEHLRDLIAVLAFGPGALHFLPRREWIRLGSLADLELEQERRITPFIRVFVFRRLPSVPSPRSRGEGTDRVPVS